MLQSVSGVNFRGDVVNSQDLISGQGRYSTAGVVSEPDVFESSEKKSNASKGLKIAGAIVALAALAWAGLGIAVGRKGSNWQKIAAEEGKELKFMQKVKNVFYEIGNSAVTAYKAVFKHGEKAAEKAAKAE